jgi:hypothetical protein
MGLEVAERLEFGVLSLLEVRRPGEPVWLGGERQPVLLALLDVHANELARVERLVDELFGGQRSDAAVNAVRDCGLAAAAAARKWCPRGRCAGPCG